MGQDELIWGRNVVASALESGRALNKILLGSDSGRDIARIRALAKKRQIPVENTNRRRLDDLTGGVKHQGVVALASPHVYAEASDILARAKAQNEPPLILMLANVEDPRNLGAAARTAAAAGVHGIIIPTRRAAPVTAVAAKAAAGALDHVPVARVVNLARLLGELKSSGLWAVGADMEGDKLYFDVDLTGPLVVVVGGEDKGLGKLLARECDHIVRIPMQPKVPSLNTSVAASLLLYEVVRQRIRAG
ncbi:MAG: 23S rRNA (guanosine(2251)-2'-O)-methyltransferase RlmB [bacterium]|jgi:23S rRNA (guanosine2251-2'-O)-methyltransferase